jgi:hypothetical protein
MRILFVVAALALTLGLTAGASSRSVARFQERQSFYASEGSHSGQTQVWRMTILVSGTADTIGNGVWTCTRVANFHRCHGSYILPQGTIEVAGVYRDSRAVMYMAIVGGTGTYSGAAGAFSSIGSLTFRDLTFALN